MDQDGNILMKLVTVEMPNRRDSSEPDTCSRCGNLTVAGIYEMSDPAVLFFSSEGLIRSGIPVAEDDEYEEDELWREEE